MTRLQFIATITAIPFIGRLFKEKEPYHVCQFTIDGRSPEIFIDNNLMKDYRHWPNPMSIDELREKELFILQDRQHQSTPIFHYKSDNVILNKDGTIQKLINNI